MGQLRKSLEFDNYCRQVGLSQPICGTELGALVAELKAVQRLGFGAGVCS